jgi:hypothetical protein
MKQQVLELNINNVPSSLNLSAIGCYIQDGKELVEIKEYIDKKAKPRPLEPSQLRFEFKENTPEVIDLYNLSPVKMKALDNLFQNTYNLKKITGTKHFTQENVKNIGSLRSMFSAARSLEDDGGLLDLHYTITQEYGIDSIFYNCGLPVQSLANITYSDSLTKLRFTQVFRSTKATTVDLSNQDLYSLQQRLGSGFNYTFSFDYSDTVINVITNEKTILPDVDLYFSWSKMTKQSVLNIFNALPTSTNGSVIRISGGNWYKELTEEEKLIPVNKGWTLQRG